MMKYTCLAQLLVSICGSESVYFCIYTGHVLLLLRLND
uniref:Uncharacterized protein n=1 Tax=Arundo donax TaxID=35708 RepID=A0A0A9CAB4_ARUDO